MHCYLVVLFHFSFQFLYIYIYIYIYVSYCKIFIITSFFYVLYDTIHEFITIIILYTIFIIEFLLLSFCSFPIRYISYFLIVVFSLQYLCFHCIHICILLCSHCYVCIGDSSSCPFNSSWDG